ncbi:MAG: NAD-binding protein [Candidatus Eisenbacteria bacterium]|nr:NAD-binding protein [Candidatus Eisenbacteria bacterium]
MEQDHVTVVGAGTMGAGIAQVFAQVGYRVDLVDLDDEILAGSRDRIERSVKKLASRGAIDPSRMDGILERIHTVRGLPNILPSFLVVEAVTESFDVKSDVFRRLDLAAPREAILTTNTSSLSVTGLASLTGRPERVMGTHFMNPPPLIDLVELVRGDMTGDDIYARMDVLVRRLGKQPVEVQDFPGLVSNRILMPMINEAIYAVMEGVASAEAIDMVMRAGLNHLMGPLHLADFIGLDVTLQVLENLYDGFSDPKYRPCPLLRRMVEAGYLGRKSGRGFFEYED